MRGLTRKELEGMGINIYQDPSEACGYRVTRYGRKNKSHTKTLKDIHPCLNMKIHPYGDDKLYWVCNWSYEGKLCSYPLSRMLYAWYKGDVPSNMDVDHIDNNSTNNLISNLQLLSRKDNLAKRKGKKNQYM